MQTGQDIGTPNQGTGVSLGGWSWSMVPGSWWAEITRDITGDSVSPYNALLQALMASHGSTFQGGWSVGTAQGANSLYSQRANYVPGTQPLVPYTVWEYPTPVDPPAMPFFATQSEENWPPDGLFGVSVTLGSPVIHGTGFSTASNLIVNGTYVLGCAIPSVLYTIKSIDSDTQLTLTSDFTGPFVQNGYGQYGIYGPFNLPPNYAQVVTGDHHLCVLMRDEATGRPGKLWEGYQVYSPDGGTTWLAGAVAVWDLVTGAQRPDGAGAVTGGSMPFFPGLVRYEDALNGGVAGAYYGDCGIDILTGDNSFSSGNSPNVWPTLSGAAGYGSGSYKAGYLVYGSRLRLSAAWYAANVPGSYSTVVKNILYRLRHYGLIIEDSTNGYILELNGIGDNRWLQSDLTALAAIPVTAFEMIDTVKPQATLTGPTTITHGIAATYTINYPNTANTNFSANMYAYYSTDGTNYNSISPGPPAISNTSPSVTFSFTAPSAGSYLLKFTIPDLHWILSDPLAVTAT